MPPITSFETKQQNDLEEFEHELDIMDTEDLIELADILDEVDAIEELVHEDAEKTELLEELTDDILSSPLEFSEQNDLGDLLELVEVIEVMEVIDQMSEVVGKMDIEEDDEMLGPMDDSAFDDFDGMSPMDYEIPASFADNYPEYELTIEFEPAEISDNVNGATSSTFPKEYIQIGLFLFAPMLLALFAYEFNALWKQFKINRRAQYARLPTYESDLKLEGNFLMERKSKMRPIGMQACAFGFSLFWFSAMILTGATLLQIA